MSLDEFQQIFRRLERRLRDSRVVEIVSNIAYRIDSKIEFTDEQNVTPVLQALRDQKIEARLERDEEHSTWTVMYHDPTNAERAIGVELANQPEYRRMRNMARMVAKYNQPPFTVMRESKSETQPDWRDLLDYVKAEGMREVSIQRYKGLGEMNSEQLWETTMNPDKRTLLKVNLEDLTETETIFSTLMGEDVESRRKFIEENALDVRNLDV
jgi:DNA gyrase subunit B